MRAWRTRPSAGGGARWRSVAPALALAVLAACAEYEPMEPTFYRNRVVTETRRVTPPLPPSRPGIPGGPTTATRGGTAALAPPHARLYRVREGDTVYGISRRFGVDMAALVRINQMAPPYRINAGERLILPNKAPPARAGAETGRGAVRPDVAVASLSPVAAPPPPPAPPPQAAFPNTPPLDIAPPPRAGDGFLWPVHGRILTPFGKQPDGLRNDGINIAAKEGTPVRAADNGVVVYAGNELPGFGNLLILRHAGGWMTAYGHNERLMVHPGETVRRGQIVATVGHTGGVSRPQLHFEIRRKGGAVDPTLYLAHAGA